MTTHSAKVQKLIDRVDRLVAQLDDAQVRLRVELAAEAAAAELKELDARRAELKVTLHRSRGVDRSDVRTWAAEQGMHVSTRGRLPSHVLTAYHQAHAA